MGRKSVRDMGPVERWLHSLTVRSTIGVQLLALAVGAIVLFAGFMLYYKGIIYEYKVETSQMAKAESVMLDPEKTREYMRSIRPELKAYIDVLPRNGEAVCEVVEQD